MHHPAPALIRFVILNCVFYEYVSQIDPRIQVILGSSVDRMSDLKSVGPEFNPKWGKNFFLINWQNMFFKKNVKSYFYLIAQLSYFFRIRLNYVTLSFIYKTYKKCMYWWVLRWCWWYPPRGLELTTSRVRDNYAILHTMTNLQVMWQLF